MIIHQLENKHVKPETHHICALIGQKRGENARFAADALANPNNDYYERRAD
jgi:hypothetical protein